MSRLPFDCARCARFAHGDTVYVTLSLSKRRRDLALLRWPFDCAPAALRSR
jgi:hypothetical protein